MNKTNGVSKLTPPDFTQSPRIDKVGVEERVARFQSRSIKNDMKIIW